MATTLETHNLTKRYGAVAAVDRLTMTVRPGRVTGFVGPNGAGKTTTMQILLGLTSANEGEALVGGRTYTTISRPLTVVGALLDADAVHPSRSARSHLRWLAESNAIPRGRADDVLGLVGLTERAGRRVGTFSLGMKQRLGIAAALLGDPGVLILDEPTNGLDPEGIHWMRETLRSFAVEGRTVLISSHLMSELEGTANQVIVIGRGRLLADMAVEDLISSASHEHVHITTPDATAAMAILAALGATVVSTGRDSLAIEGLTAARVAEALAGAGLGLEQLTSGRVTLEEAYFKLTRGTEQHLATPIDAEGSRR